MRYINYLLYTLLFILVPILYASAGSYYIYNGSVIPTVVSGTWVYNNDHEPSSGDSTVSITNTVHVGGLITAPTGATKISKIRWAVVDGSVSTNVIFCVYEQSGGNPLGSSTAYLPGSSTGFYILESSTLNISVTEGNSYFILVCPESDIDEYYNSAASGIYLIQSYSSTCAEEVIPLVDPGYSHDVGVLFE